MDMYDPKIVVFGAGAIGGSVGAWVAEHYGNIFLYDKKEVVDAMRTKGVTTYLGEKPGDRSQVTVRTVSSISEIRDADVIVVAVKTYSLDAVCAELRKVCADRPVIVAMQNGAENQRIVPRHFSKVIYGVIGYNAWLDDAVTIGYQKKGPLVLGTVDNALMPEMRALAGIFSRGVETVVVDHLQDAVHSKIVINLTNSLTTLIGFGFREISDYGLFQKILPNLTWEGVRIVKAAGYHECKIGGMPPWLILRAGATLPAFLTKGIFRKNIKKMVISSMAQDVITRGSGNTELETINGYILSLAEKHGIAAPYNKAVYDLCAREFAKPAFTPLDIREVWDEVQRRLREA